METVPSRGDSMSKLIKVDKGRKRFHLSTQNTSYVIEILNDSTISHMYYGPKINNYNGSKKYIYMDRGFSPNPNGEDSTFSYDTIPQEYPTNGNGDFRVPAYQTLEKNGSRVSNFKFIDFEIIDGKPALDGLPSTYETKNDEVKTLKIIAKDHINGLKIHLNYSVFYHSDVITRDVKFINDGSNTINLLRAMSMNIDFRDPNFEMITLYGRHNNERNFIRRKIVPGIQAVESTRTSSSSHQAPFIALAKPSTNESFGEIYGFNFVYSGNFLAQLQLDSYENTRLSIGINPYDFSWKLEPEKSFQTPEVVMTFSNEGLGGMSRKFHNFYREHLIRGKYKYKERPVVLNNWEATYFDFTEEKILELAKEGKNLGIELFVLDDGWFGKRNDINSSLGDWYPDKAKIPNGLSSLAKKIKALGLEFGIWFEPEMVSPDSDLYRAHPEWCIGIPGREKSLGRMQHVLDLSRTDVQDYIYDAVCKILETVPVDYVKWDMNRNVTELWSNKLPADQQQEVSHRYVLGLYKVLDRITTDFPNVLFENCSSGGGRYDPGMLYYMPQSWTSDNTDAVGRLEIQYGTSLTYPAITMGAHVSAIPNHQVGRTTPLKTRGDVAMAGNLGYELDVTKLSKIEKKEIQEQITFYKRNRKLIQFGNHYRLETYDKNEFSWMFINNEQTEFLLTYVKVLSVPGAPIRFLRLSGLDPSAFYENEDTNEIFGGDELMNAGISIPRVKEDFHSMVWKFKKV